MENAVSVAKFCEILSEGIILIGVNSCALSFPRKRESIGLHVLDACFRRHDTVIGNLPKSAFI